MAGNVKEVKDADFDAVVLGAKIPVLVDFWASWCGPCRMLGPLVEEVADQYAGKVLVAKMNVDENKVVPQKYGIRGIPTIMVFKDGQAVATSVGAIPKSQIEDLLKKAGV